jgi:CRP/FNR family transcriptional regulator, dissimilatory nitrate respiration regulator
MTTRVMQTDAGMPTRPIRIEKFLVNLPLFRQLDSDEIGRIAQGATEIDAARGTMLFRRGDPCHGFHVVIYGQVKLALQTQQGDEKVIEIMGPGQSFGEAVMFLDKPYMVCAQTLGDSKLLHVSKDIVFSELEREPRFARRMLAGLSLRLHHLISDLEAMSLRSGIQRVIACLLRDLPQDSEGGAEKITLPAPKGVLASQLGLTQEHFSRLLRQLSEAGLIEVHNREINIPDVEKLRAYKH